MIGLLKRYLSALLVFLMLFSTIGMIDLSYADTPPGKPEKVTLTVSTNGHCFVELDLYNNDRDRQKGNTNIGYDQVGAHNYIVDNGGRAYFRIFAEFGYYVKEVLVNGEKPKQVPGYSDIPGYYYIPYISKNQNIEIIVEKNAVRGPLENGKYKVLTALKWADEVNSPLVYETKFTKQGVLEVTDNQWYLTVEVDKILSRGRWGKLAKLKYFDPDMPRDITQEYFGKFRDVEVIDYYYDQDGVNTGAARTIKIPLKPQAAGTYLIADPMEEHPPAFYIGFENPNRIIYQKGTFKYLGDEEERFDYQADYYYSDDNFLISSYDFNQQLATMSLCFQLSSWSSAEKEKYTEKSENAVNLLNELGFSNIVINSDYKVEPKIDSIGAVIGQKQIVVDGKNYTLIALAVRGGGYGKEWAGNFAIGRGGMHEGFHKASLKIIAFLQDYISDQKISGDVKLWLTGYSRGGAVANLVAGALNDNTELIATKFDSSLGLAKPALAVENIYAYTFEAPAATIAENARDSKYHNIFNIVNVNDIVTKVAPAYWNFQRYGTDKVLPHLLGENTALFKASLEKMKARYQIVKPEDSSDISLGVAGKLNLYAYIIDQFKMKKTNFKGDIFDQADDLQKMQYEFLNDYSNLLTESLIKNRDNYVDNYQSEIAYLCELYFGASIKQTKILEENIKSNISKLFLTLGVEYRGFIRPTAKYKLTHDFIYILKVGFKTAKIEYDEQEFEKNVRPIVELLLDAAFKDEYSLVTLVDNSHGIAQAHQPYLCLAWLQSMDDNYAVDAKAYWISGAAKKVKINCPVDIEVYNASNELVATIIDDMPQNTTAGSRVAYMDQNGEKTFLLAPDADYTMKITATDNGEMDVSILETMPFVSGANRIVNYYDLPLQTGDVYIATIPKYSDDDMQLAFKQTLNGSETAYTLSQNGAKIEPNLELSGQAATDAVYTVETMVNDTSLGFVFGGGPSQVGRYDRLEAVPTDGSRFTGWYQDGVLLSTEPVYRLRVTEDNKIEARFAPVSYTVRFVDWDDSELSVQTVSHGAIAIAPAAPSRVGYTFTGWNKDFNDVKSDLTVKALYNDGNYRVSFIDWDDTVLKIDTVTHGAVAIAPAAPSRAGYTFTGWDKSFAEVISDLVVRAQYEKVTPSIEPPTEGETVENSATDTDDDDWVIVSPAEQMDNTNSQNDGPTADNTATLEAVSQAVADNLARYNRLPLPQAAYYTDGTVKTVTIELTGLEAESNYGVVLVNKNGQAEVIDGTRRADQFTVTLPEGGILLLYKREILPASGKLSFKPVALTDLDGHWSEAVVRDLAARGIISPRQASLYQPDRAITRAEFISAIISYLSVPQQTATAFEDVKADHPHRAAIETARAIGLVEGVGGNAFAPDQAISRQDLATIINRLLPLIAVTDDDLRPNRALELNRFSDHKAVSAYAKAALTRLIQAGMIKGTPGGQLMPQSNTTRAETAQLLYNLIMVLSNK